jgi:hypothetical protein
MVLLSFAKILDNSGSHLAIMTNQQVITYGDECSTDSYLHCDHCSFCKMTTATIFATGYRILYPSSSLLFFAHSHTHLVVDVDGSTDAIYKLLPLPLNAASSSSYYCNCNQKSADWPTTTPVVTNPAQSAGRRGTAIVSTPSKAAEQWEEVAGTANSAVQPRPPLPIRQRCTRHLRPSLQPSESSYTSSVALPTVADF